ncbi:SMC-Scp complex subunit ScpB [Marinicrinis lubricantis]|uniref:Segregation and condensation protein B n=1 Tax=Marinicrinis lubricantis TaxID=2086470 RepID=A0ABW1ISR3_9BACL
MDQAQMKSVIEGLLFAVGDEGLEAKQIAEVLEVDPALVVKLLQQMKEDYKAQQRGIQILEIAGAYELTTLPSHAVYFQRLAHTPTRGTLSQAALETLAIVAYRQPITRVDIEEIRGVKSDRAIHTLVAKELICEVARAEAIGRPILYGTTKQFLDYFGLNHIDELPSTGMAMSAEDLEQETRMLFEKLDAKQITLDEVED